MRTVRCSSHQLGGVGVSAHGVCLPGGVCLGGVCPGGCVSFPGGFAQGCLPRVRGCLPGGCLPRGCLPGEGVSAQGRVCLPRRVSAYGGVCPGGVFAQGGVCLGVSGRHPPCEQNDWQTGVKTLPCRNFVAGGNKIEAYWKLRTRTPLMLRSI